MERVAVGIGVRDEYFDSLVALRDRRALDILEVQIDDGLDEGPQRTAWRRLGARWPLVAHGTELGIADAAGPSESYVARVASALGSIRALWYSEHLSFLSAGNIALGHFAPLMSGPSADAVLRDNAALVRERVACPFLLENPADVLGWEKEIGGAALAARYEAHVCVAEAGALLDLTNVVLSARNDGYDAGEYVAAMKLDHVVEVHLAGGRFDGTLWIDSHDHDVDEEALDLVASVARRAPSLRAVIVERDDRLPSLDALLGEVERVRAVVAAAGRA